MTRSEQVRRYLLVLVVAALAGIVLLVVTAPPPPSSTPSENRPITPATAAPVAPYIESG